MSTVQFIELTPSEVADVAGGVDWKYAVPTVAAGASCAGGVGAIVATDGALGWGLGARTFGACLGFGYAAGSFLFG
jgi:hypothetical protein